MVEKFTISENLSLMLEAMNDAQRMEVQQMLNFYYQQYKNLLDNPAINAESIASSINQEVDRMMQERIDNEDKYTPSCKKGCSFCCFGRVDISKEEAILVSGFAKEQGIRPNRLTLKRQAATKTEADYMNLPLKYRRCVFLNQDGECSVYEHRPSACRKLIVVSHPSLCDTDANKGEKVGRMAELESEVLAIASLNASEKSGSMAEMLIYVNK